MPIKPENRSKYPANWRELSRRIRHERAGNRCEKCGAPNGETVLRGRLDDVDVYIPFGGKVYDAETGELRGDMSGYDYDWIEKPRSVKIVLTTAHLDHDPTNNDETNLKALCQQCHLRHDAKLHAANARETRRRKNGQRSLWEDT
jgi:5-methylcytosine-specific restriction endonuclease McrA